MPRGKPGTRKRPPPKGKKALEKLDNREGVLAGTEQEQLALVKLGLTGEEAGFCLAFAVTGNISASAREVGRTQQWGSNRLSHPLMSEALSRLAAMRAKAITPMATAALERIISSEKTEDKDAINAAKLIMEAGLHKDPVLHVHQNDGETLDDIKQEIADLAKQLGLSTVEVKSIAKEVTDVEETD
jgi:hypothetical protein